MAGARAQWLPDGSRPDLHAVLTVAVSVALLPYGGPDVTGIDPVRSPLSMAT